MATERTDVRTGVGPGRRTRSYGSGRTSTETKAGFKTTEFMVALAAIVAILIATYVADADLRGLEIQVLGGCRVHREPRSGEARHPRAIHRAPRQRLRTAGPASRWGESLDRPDGSRSAATRSGSLPRAAFPRPSRTR
jgi:hypothetical protein